MEIRQKRDGNIPPGKEFSESTDTEGAESKMTRTAIGNEKSRKFPIVGIGASAGGLASFKSFLATMPIDSGMAFVLVPHLDPARKSLMVDLLARQTSMSIAEIHDGMRVEQNHVYVIPPNYFLTISEGILHLADPPSGKPFQTAIDLFLRSLAEDRREYAVGIVFSGTGSSGTLGIREIKRLGGLAIAQSPESAEYPSMPSGVIATGLADYVLPPDQIPEALLKYGQQPYLMQSNNQAAPTEEKLAKLRMVIELLRSRTQHDFRCYRTKMLLRRIQRRMSIVHIDELSEYVQFLQDNRQEIATLCNDFLIGVTAFFRDPEAFELLEREIVPKLIAQQIGDQPIRIWVPGCSTGEEAYSLAILFCEGFLAADKPVRFQIFASDVDEQSIEVARTGIYPSSIAIDISPERLSRFFVKTDDNYFQVIKKLRDPVVFSRQDLISDAPFSRLNLISCRNLMIYLEPEMQQKLLALFHFALVHDGHLLLGPSETIGSSIDLFEPVSKKWRVYKSIGPSRQNQIDIPHFPDTSRQRVDQSEAPMFDPGKRVTQLAEKLILREIAPAAVLINQKYEVLYLVGPVGDFLEIPQGEPTSDLLSMARTGLRTKIRAACVWANREQASVTDENARVKRNGNYVPCTVSVRIFTEPKEATGLMLLIFRDKVSEQGVPSTIDARVIPPEAESSLVQHLEFELKSTLADLQSTIEDLESSNEELKASNEEMMSMNEELQSANEELETSKEELQSLNEELNTVNSQLEGKVADLDKSNSDISNLIASTGIATVFLDTQLCIQRFTPVTFKLLKLRPADIGRPLSDLASSFSDEAMLEDCRRVMETQIPVESEIQSKDGLTYIRRILPYRTTEEIIDGVVISYFDLTQQKKSEEALRKSELRFRKVFENAVTGIAIMDWNGRFESCNPSYTTLVGREEEELYQLNVASIIHPEDLAAYHSMIKRLKDGEVKHFEIENRCLHKSGNIAWIRQFVSVLPDIEGHPTHLLALITDTTELKRHVDNWRESNQRMQAILTTASDAIVTINEKGIIDSINPATEKLFGYSSDELVGKNVRMLMPPPYSDEHDDYLQRFKTTGEPHIIGTGREVVAKCKDGTLVSVDLAVSQVDHMGLFTGILRDVTYRKELEKRVLDIADEEQRRIGQELHDGTQQELTGLAMLSGTLLQSIKLASQIEVDEKPVWQLTEEEHSRLLSTSTLIMQRLTEANRNIHQLSHGIMPVQVDAEGLRSALEDLAITTNLQENLKCDFQCDQPVALQDNSTATHLYRIAQEALTNALRHGQPTEISIVLFQDSEQITLEVQDNGRGINWDEYQKRRGERNMGLRIMEYRARMIGGLLRIEPRAGGGTIIRCQVPCNIGVHNE